MSEKVSRDDCAIEKVNRRLACNMIIKTICSDKIIVIRIEMVKASDMEDTAKRSRYWTWKISINYIVVLITLPRQCDGTKAKK